ncbi:unnamed protein product [Coffea canephora]|uniref:Uncharacterized protein n=1 Tax=Coffea canephora TaxID=49390 RepID=A0A068V4Q2_COFCA|nr:unnamed protein product [Coffea canephora]
MKVIRFTERGMEIGGILLLPRREEKRGREVGGAKVTLVLSAFWSFSILRIRTFSCLRLGLYKNLGIGSDQNSFHLSVI